LGGVLAANEIVSQQAASPFLLSLEGKKAGRLPLSGPPIAF